MSKNNFVVIKAKRGYTHRAKANLGGIVTLTKLPGIGTVDLAGEDHYLGFKVVTTEMQSLGLRRNPDIRQYEVGQWETVKPEEQIVGNADAGGIWVARTLSQARGLVLYRLKHYRKNSRVFSAALGDILYFNSYRIKTTGVLLLDEIEVKQPLIL